ncbi:unnamed protein product [Cochlearia groenlandica]
MNTSSLLKTFTSSPPPLIFTFKPTVKKSPKARFSSKNIKSMHDSMTNLAFGSNMKPSSQELSVSFATTTTNYVVDVDRADSKNSEMNRPVFTTTDKLDLIVSEFKSLTEPIDRVKRLLNYATTLAPLDDSARCHANRVAGCTTQVWLETKIDEFGRMRFKADSDSEISKGFCSCLIYILDGAKPEEALNVKSEDLTAMNVGVHGKSKSRVNTWHNVLMTMQKQTVAIVDVADVACRGGDRVTRHGVFVESSKSKVYYDYSISLLPLYYDFSI